MSSNATAGSAFEGDRAGPASPAKPGDPRAPAKAELGERSKHKTSPPPRQKFLDSRKRRKDPGGPGIYGHTKVVRRLRGNEI